MSSEGYHEALELLSEDTKNMHRAVVSLREELDAVDWYQQRAEGCSDPELRAVLLHNRSEEIEHAMMVLEWIRRRDPTFDANIGTYLKTSGAITEIEGGKNGRTGGGPGESVGPSTSLGIGSLREAT